MNRDEMKLIAQTEIRKAREMIELCLDEGGTAAAERLAGELVGKASMARALELISSDDYMAILTYQNWVGKECKLIRIDQLDEYLHQNYKGPNRA